MREHLDRTDQIPISFDDFMKMEIRADPYPKALETLRGP